MSAPPGGEATLVQSLATLLRNSGDSVLDGTSTLTLRTSCLQHLTRLFEQHLLSRTHQHGFLALPSHPADTSSLLQLQFLFDMLQKTISLKLIHPARCRLQSVVKIFPFKSLKCLELKRVPPHSLEGLRAVYSQLEVFICSKSISSLEELLSLCGGDLSSALPWLELHTLNFSYNSIVSLDESLSLLNVLKSLDLSHNRIQDCSEFLLPLTELEHLNLGYNYLQGVPSLGLHSRARLVTLILRNNELETINGVEHLCSLQHLDLAYNLLVEHSQLAPLSLLHCLSTLQLDGNPLYFEKSHRTSTVRHLSPKAALQRLKLDGCPLTSSELAVLPKSGQLMGQVAWTLPPPAEVSERGNQEVSSGGGDMSDSLSVSEPVVSRLQKKKSRSRVRVRRASISEPSDTDFESKGTPVQQEIVLPHQKEIERMDVFRDQLGEDWLRYKHHLEGVPAQQAEPSSGVLKSNGHCVPASSVVGHPVPLQDCHLAPLLASEPKEDGSDPETESTLHWPGRSPDNTGSTLDTSLGPLGGPKDDLPQVEEEDEELGVDLCLPLLVGLLPEENCKEVIERKAPCPLFLRLKPGHALEVDVHSGIVLARLELDSLREVTTSQTTWVDKEGERCLPALELHFCYISRARRRRRYVVLDDDPQEALQALAEVLLRVAEENGRQAEEGQVRAERLQCLRCHMEFSQQSRGSEEENGEEEGQERIRTAAAGLSSLICQECGSDHVVQLAGPLAPSTSTPVQDASDTDGPAHRFAFDTAVEHDPQDLSAVTAAPLRGIPDDTDQSQGTAAQEEAELTNTFFTAKSAPSGTGSDGLSSFHTPGQVDGLPSPPGADSEEDLASSWSYSYSAPRMQPRQTPPTEGSSPAQLNLISEDAEVVDHRLKLFLDVDVFEEDTEELRCFLKMSTVKFGDPNEFPSLLVVSDQRFYFLEVTSEIHGQPSDWLRKRDRHSVAELCYLEVGLGSQSLHLQFEGAGASYTLLVRHSARCKSFFNLLTGIARELASKSDSRLQAISTTRLDPQHHLWPLVCDVTQPNSEEDVQPQFFYVLAFTRRGDGITPVTVLATQETLYLLKEDHQWSRTPSSLQHGEDNESREGKVTVQESQPISCVSSVHLFSADPLRVDIKLYDEMLKEEKMWTLRTGSEELTVELVDWVKTHWEAMFGVKLSTTLQGSES